MPYAPSGSNRNKPTNQNLLNTDSQFSFIECVVSSLIATSFSSLVCLFVISKIGK
jgi:hypothetical protein